MAVGSVLTPLRAGCCSTFFSIQNRVNANAQGLGGAAALATWAHLPCRPETMISDHGG